MIGPASALDPHAGGDDAFCDALAGLGCVCSRVAHLLDHAMLTADVEAPGAGRDEPPGGDDPPDDLVDAVLGLASLRNTVDLVLGALGGVVGPDDVHAEEPSSWSREHLR